jgi:hypothetical protein
LFKLNMAATTLRVFTAIGFDAFKRRIDPAIWSLKASRRIS